MTVRAGLDGHEFDLRTLVDLFPEGDPRVVTDQDAGRYYLESSQLDPHFNDGGRMLGVAERILGRLAAVARLQPAEFGEVALTGHFDRASAGAGAHTAGHGSDSWGWRERATVARAGSAEAHAQIRATAAGIHPDGMSVEPAQPRGLRYLNLAQAHPEVDELLQLLSTSDMQWNDLYQGYEIVNDATGRGQKTRWALEPLGYSKEEVRDFTGSVNLHRHARPSGRPRRELSLAECRQFVRDLAERWLQQLESGDG